MERILWDDYFMEMVEVVKKRSTCLRHKFGAIVTIDNKIRGTGYNGAPSGLQHCSETGCIRDKLKIESGTRAEICRAVHAEQNAVLQALKFGSIENGTLYVNAIPCNMCSRLIINSGIKRLVFKGEYADTSGLELLEEAGVSISRIG